VLISLVNRLTTVIEMMLSLNVPDLSKHINENCVPCLFYSVPVLVCGVCHAVVALCCLKALCTVGHTELTQW
jgi:hypothetical protein